MKINNIHNTWGTIVEFNDPLEFFNQPIGYWRKLLYDRKLIFFKKMDFSLVDYAKFGYYFGKPWDIEDYNYSHEKCVSVSDLDKTYYVTEFNNFIHHNRIANKLMPFHADIPNRTTNPFPHRSLWIVKNPNKLLSGHTYWLNIEDGIEYLSPTLIDLIPRIKVLQQSWYVKGTDEKLFDFIKVHPITNKKSLRLNYYVTPGNESAWIKEVHIDGIKQPDCSLIQEYIDHLLEYPELFIKHVWDTTDIAVYDNYSSIHGRTQLVLGDTAEDNERKFYRMNIDHIHDQNMLF
jgi:alpha-ketoglutarate-dependent taurine dioxygenase